MTRFPTDGHLASWSCVCPGQHESAGKRHCGQTRKGDRWLPIPLVQGRSEERHHLGPGISGCEADLAPTALRLPSPMPLWSMHHLSKNGGQYEDPGPNYFDERRKESTGRRAVKRIENLGHQVTLTQAVPS